MAGGSPAALANFLMRFRQRRTRLRNVSSLSQLVLRHRLPLSVKGYRSGESSPSIARRKGSARAIINAAPTPLTSPQPSKTTLCPSSPMAILISTRTTPSCSGISAWNVVGGAPLVLTDDERKKAVGRKVALAQGFRMRCDGTVEDTTDGRCVTPIKVEDALCHNIRRFGEVPNNPARLAVPGEEGSVLHPIHHGRRADIPERHFTVRSRRTFVGEEINLVGFGGILVFLTGGKHCKTAIDALRALPAMRMKRRHVADAGAAPGVPDEAAATVLRNSFDDFCLRRPGERDCRHRSRCRAPQRTSSGTPPGSADASFVSPWRRRPGQPGGRFKLTTPFSKKRMLSRPNILAVTTPSAAKRKDRVRWVGS